MGGLEILSLGVDGGFDCLSDGEVREGGFIFEIEGLDGFFSYFTDGMEISEMLVERGEGLSLDVDGYVVLVCLDGGEIRGEDSSIDDKTEGIDGFFSCFMDGTLTSRMAVEGIRWADGFDG